MRCRRQSLQVSTFPFLAVLLCAMGSLILVLLAMDLKAKKAARARVAQAHTRAVAEAARAAEAERAEVEAQRRAALRDWEEKKQALHARLSREEAELQEKLRQVREQFAEAAARLRAEEAGVQELPGRIRAERGKLEESGRELALRRARAAEAEARTEADRKALRRMTVDLVQLEQALADLKAARQRERQTYSVVPYHGKRGESRRPLYVECVSGGVIFHPERLSLDPELSAQAVRAEVERRMARQQEQLKAAGLPGEEKTYLMLLVRPDAVPNYYRLLNALHGLPLEFGYEFIDADWVLDFPAESQPLGQPWQALAKDTVPAPGVPTRGGEPLKGVRPGSLLPAANAGPSLTGGTTTGPGSGSPSGSGVPQGGGTPGIPGFGVPGVVAASGGSPSAEASPSPGTHAPQGVNFSGGANLSPEHRGEGPGPLSHLAPEYRGERAGGRGGIGTGSDPSPPTPLPGVSGRGGEVGETPATGVPGRGGSNERTGLDAAGAQASLSPIRAGGPEVLFPSFRNPGQPSPGGGGSTNGRSGSGILPPVRSLAGVTPGTPAPEATMGGPLPEVPSAGPARGHPSPGQPPLNPGLAPPTGSVSQPAPTGTPSAPTPPTASANAPATPGAGPPQPGSPSTSPAGQAVPGVPSDTGPGGNGEPGAAATGGVSGAGSGSSRGGGMAVQDSFPNNPLPGLPSPRPLQKGLPRAVPMRPARLSGDRDWVIYIECQPDGLVLYPSQRYFPLKGVTASAEPNPLRQAVQQMIDRRQAGVPPGELPYRPQVRFLVRPESLRTFHLAYPALEALAVPKTRQNLIPEDDVATIVTGP